MDAPADDADVPPRYAWTITCDYVADRFDDDLKPLIVCLVGLVGPENCTLTSAEIANDPQAVPFRLSDDIGVLFEGFLLGEVGDLPPHIPGVAEPWRSICGGWPRIVELFQRGRWQQGEYQGMFFDDWTPFGL